MTAALCAAIIALAASVLRRLLLPQHLRLRDGLRDAEALCRDDAMARWDAEFEQATGRPVWRALGLQSSGSALGITATEAAGALAKLGRTMRVGPATVVHVQAGTVPYAGKLETGVLRSSVERDRDGHKWVSLSRGDACCCYCGAPRPRAASMFDYTPVLDDTCSVRINRRRDVQSMG